MSNTPASVSVSEKQDLSLYNTGLGDAYEGGADYFVQIKLFYDGSAQNKTGTPKKAGKKNMVVNMIRGDEGKLVWKELTGQLLRLLQAKK